ncbi:MAG TPA: CDP-diacylglycerol--glycerol-3-phosphate 3-phosphatidyltransferase [Myxococcota bacterium]|nr:CDP-diacylglycerol--glycerol-3-phosphate 3-phosphatidyltransferase [Myxococcota bacterium]
MAISVDDRPVGAARRAAEPVRIMREKFWNVPNTITVVRVGVVPILLLLPWFDDRPGSLFIGWCFAIAAFSDLLDGWLARRGQQVTRIGKLLDPLADKLIVSTALIVLVATDRIPGWATWMAVVIVGRELAVTGLRGLASSQGQVMAASGYGKLKTFSQNVAIGAMIFHYPRLVFSFQDIGLALLAFATALTLGSGYAYFADYFRAERAQGTGRPPASGSAT